MSPRTLYCGTLTRTNFRDSTPPAKRYKHPSGTQTGQLIGCSLQSDGLLTMTLRYIFRQSGFWHRAAWYIDMAYLPDCTWEVSVPEVDAMLQRRLQQEGQQTMDVRLATPWSTYKKSIQQLHWFSGFHRCYWSNSELLRFKTVQSCKVTLMFRKTSCFIFSVTNSITLKMETANFFETSAFIHSPSRC